MKEKKFKIGGTTRIFIPKIQNAASERVLGQIEIRLDSHVIFCCVCFDSHVVGTSGSFPNFHFVHPEPHPIPLQIAGLPRSTMRRNVSPPFLPPIATEPRRGSRSFNSAPYRLRVTTVDRLETSSGTKLSWTDMYPTAAAHLAHIAGMEPYELQLRDEAYSWCHTICPLEGSCMHRKTCATMAQMAKTL